MPTTITLSCGHVVEDRPHGAVPGIPGTMQVQHTCPTCGSVEVKSRAATPAERTVNAETDAARAQAEAMAKRDDEPTSEVRPPGSPTRASARAPR